MRLGHNGIRFVGMSRARSRSRTCIRPTSPAACGDARLRYTRTRYIGPCTPTASPAHKHSARLKLLLGCCKQAACHMRRTSDHERPLLRHGQGKPPKPAWHPKPYRQDLDTRRRGPTDATQLGEGVGRQRSVIAEARIGNASLPGKAAARHSPWQGSRRMGTVA